jgi:hypothetical protein
MLEIDMEEIEELAAKVKRINKIGFPIATQQTINRAAFEARAEYQEQMRNKMTTRNKFTEKSAIVKPSRTLHISRQEAIVGSTQKYMETQEFGGTEVAKGRHGVVIPTSYAAGQRGARPRTRLVQKANRMANIKLRRRIGRTQKQKNIIAVKQAAATGQKYAFIDTGRKKFIGKVIGGKRRPRVQMVQDLSRKTVTIPARPMLGPAVNKVVPSMPLFYRESLKFQLKRFGLI